MASQSSQSHEPSRPAAPSQPNERTVAIGQHKIERAVFWWRNGHELIRREPFGRREQYERAVQAVLPTLAPIQNIAVLISSY